jgi:nucleoside-diphosphate-sugar epimerase
MRVVVTGAAGMIAATIVHGLNALGHRRRDRRSTT